MLERIKTAWIMFRLSFHLTPQEVEFVVAGLKQMQAISGMGPEISQGIRDEIGNTKPFKLTDTIKVAEYRGETK